MKKMMSGILKNESFKSAVIVLLIVSALFLGANTNLFGDFFSTIPVFDELSGWFSGKKTVEAELPDSEITGEAARPLCIVLTNGEKRRYAEKYDFSGVDALYESTSGIIREALGSAVNTVAITEKAWLSALGEPGIYYEYSDPISLEIIKGWFGAGAKEQESCFVKRFFVAFGDEKSVLYYEDCREGSFYASDTALAAGRRPQALEISGNGARFVFEEGFKLSHDSDYFIIAPQAEYPVLTAENPLENQEKLDAVLTALGVANQYRTNVIEDGGDRIYVGNDFEVTVGADGRVDYMLSDNAVTEPFANGGDFRDREYVELARRLVDKSLGAVCGDARAYFTALERPEADVVEVMFEYFACGGKIELSEGERPARVTFVNGIISRVELLCRSYGEVGEKIELLPVRQAFAAAGGEFYLCYTDGGRQLLEPFWKRAPIQ